jgi:hypothetical protein
MSSCQNYLLDLEGRQRQIAEILSEQFLAFPGIQCRIRFRIPFFYQHSWICYLNPVKNEDIELAFIYGNRLTDPEALLQAHGRKQVKGIRLYRVHELPLEAIQVLFSEALLLDEDWKRLKKK